MAAKPELPPLPEPADGDVSRATAIIVPTVLTVVIAAVLTGLRLYVRIRMLKRLEWDDFWNVLAMLFIIVIMGLVLGATSNGFGRHFYYVNKKKAAFANELLRIGEFFLILATVFIKISITLFLKRLFLKTQAWKIFLWSFIAFNTITSVLDAAIIFPQCKPVNLNWDHSVEGHCWSNVAIDATGIVQGSIAAATDFILAILPFVFLWKIRISWQAKAGICGVMALGFASGGFAIARTILVPSLTTTHDPTWDLMPLFLWAVLEANLGVIAAAAPAVRSLFVRRSLSTKGSTPYHLSSANQPRSKKLFSRASWYGQDPELGEFRGLNGTSTTQPDDVAERVSDGDSGELKLWPEPSGKIMKTTDVSVIHTNARNKANGTPTAPVPSPPDATLR